MEEINNTPFTDILDKFKTFFRQFPFPLLVGRGSFLEQPTHNVRSQTSEIRCEVRKFISEFTSRFVD